MTTTNSWLVIFVVIFPFGTFDNQLLKFLPQSIKQRLGVLRERFSRPDAYVVSYPKSGRTWLQMMLARIYQRQVDLPLDELLQQSHRCLVRSVDGASVPFARFSHGYRYKYFCQSEDFPSWFYQGSKIVLLMRDPRDTLVSYYYWQKYNFCSFDGTLHDFIHTCGDDRHPEDHQARCGIKPILKYYNTWLAHEPEFDDLLILHYEDLRMDPVKHLRRLLDFTGHNVSDELIADAIEFASFDNMRKMEVDRQLTWSALPGGNDVRGFKTRRAKVKGFRDELNADDLAMINETIDEELNSRFSRYCSEPMVADTVSRKAG